MLYLEPGAEKDLSGLPASVRIRILQKLLFYANTPEPLTYARPLRNVRLGTYRFRIGDYRALFDVVNGHIHILTIDHRKDVYGR